MGERLVLILLGVTVYWDSNRSDLRTCRRNFPASEIGRLFPNLGIYVSSCSNREESP